MRIAPDEIRQQKFGSKFRGLNPEEVDNFLQLVAGELDEILKENITLKEELKKVRSDVDDFKKNEMNFRTMIGAAQEFKEEITSRANKEADLLLRQAELKAKEIVEKAEGKINHLEKCVADLKMKKEKFRISLKSMIENQLSLLNSHEDMSDLIS